MQYVCMYVSMYVGGIAWSVDIVRDDVGTLNVSNHIRAIRFAVVSQVANLQKS